MSRDVQALLAVLGLAFFGMLVLGAICIRDEPEVRHPYRDDIPDWW